MKQRVVFLDKDGTLINDVPYNVDPKLIQLAPGAIEGLQLLHQAGYRLIVVTNQSGVARGYFPESALAAVVAHVQQLLAEVGVPLAGFYYCPHYPQGVVAEYAINCSCRKPEPGLLLRAAIDHNIDLAQSWLIGDILNDVEAGRRAGCKTVLINNGNETEWQLSPVRTPHYIVSNLAEAGVMIKSVYKQEIIDFYNARTNYDNDATRNRAVVLFDYTTLCSEQFVLDVATGTGNIAIEAAKKVGVNGFVIAIDIAAELLKIAQQKIQAENLSNVQLIEADVETYQAEANQFDAIYCSYAVVLFPNLPAILHNWYHFLKPGGFIAFTCSSQDSYFALQIVEACAKHGVILPNLHELLGTPERIQSLLTQAKFSQIEIHPRQLGTYLTLEKAQNRWDGQFWLHPGNPLRELELEKIRQIKVSYDDEIAALETEPGVWHEELIYYVVARKP